MKKLIVGLLTSALLFSGCSLFGNPDKTMSLNDAQKMAQENPSELFYTLSKANGAYSLEILKKYLPTIETLKRYTSEYHGTLSFDLANTPMGGGKGTYALHLVSEGDYQDLQNPKQKTDFAITADIMGGMFSADIKGSLIIVKQSLFASFEKMNIGMISMPQELKTAFSNLAGKTYGNTWDEIKTLSGNELDLKKYFTSGGLLLNMLNYAEEANQNPQTYITFQKFVKEENGYFYFEATPSQEGIQKMMTMIKNILPFGASFEAEMNSASENLKALETQTITIAFNPLDRKYYITTDQHTKITHTAEETSLFFSISETESIFLSKKGNEVTGHYTNNGQTSSFLQGTLEEKKINLSLLNPDDNSIIAVMTGEKSSNGWSGEITSPIIEKAVPMLEGAKLVFSNVLMTPEKIHAKFEGVINNATAVTKELTYTIKKSSGNFDLASPKDALPFSNLASVFESFTLLDSTEDIHSEKEIQ